MKHLIVKWVDGVIVVKPKASYSGLVGGEETDALMEVLQRLDRDGTRGVVLNLRNVRFISSVAIKALERAHAWYEARGAQLVISNVNDRVIGILALVPLCFACDAFTSEREAVDALARAEHVGSAGDAAP